MKNRRHHRVDVAGRGHDQGSRPLWVSMPGISFIDFSLTLVLVREIMWEREAHINWSMVTCLGSTRSELP